MTRYRFQGWFYKEREFLARVRVSRLSGLNMDWIFRLDLASSLLHSFKCWCLSCFSLVKAWDLRWKSFSSKFVVYL